MIHSVDNYTNLFQINFKLKLYTEERLDLKSCCFVPHLRTSLQLVKLSDTQGMCLFIYLFIFIEGLWGRKDISVGRWESLW